MSAGRFPAYGGPYPNQEVEVSEFTLDGRAITDKEIFYRREFVGADRRAVLIPKHMTIGEALMKFKLLEPLS